MSSRVAAFDAWMDTAERDAVKLDAAQVSALQTDGADWLAYFAQPSTPAAEVEHARSRLLRYKELVSLLHRSLQAALLDASEQPGAGYTHDRAASRPAMLGRYG